MGDPAWAWTLQQQIPSSLEAGHALIEKLMERLSCLGWEGRDSFHVQMAAEEAMVNAVKHGNHESPNKLVEVEFKIAPTTVYMRFKDQGTGFCLSDLPDPRDEDHLECTNGRGVMLIREMMNEVHYNEIGNEVTMLKIREQ